MNPAKIINGKVVGGTKYYVRDINQQVFIDLDEDGKSRIWLYTQDWLFTQSPSISKLYK